MTRMQWFQLKYSQISKKTKMQNITTKPPSSFELYFIINNEVLVKGLPCRENSGQ